MCANYGSEHITAVPKAGHSAGGAGRAFAAQGMKEIGGRHMAAPVFDLQFFALLGA